MPVPGARFQAVAAAAETEGKTIPGHGRCSRVIAWLRSGRWVGDGGLPTRRQTALARVEHAPSITAGWGTSRNGHRVGEDIVRPLVGTPGRDGDERRGQRRLFLTER